MATREQQLSAIMTAESGGRNVLSGVPVPAGYTQNQAGSGYYQMVPSTFRQGAAWAGITVPQGAMAMNYDYATQTAAANALIDHQGLQPWSGPGGKTLSLVAQIDAGQNPKLVTGPVDGGSQGGALAANTGATTPSVANPDVILDPTTGEPIGGGSTLGTGVGGASGSPGSSGLGAIGLAGTLADIGYVPPASTGGPYTFGLASGVVQTASGWITGAETAVGNAFRAAFSGLLGTLENWVGRGFLIIIGLAILALALWRVMEAPPALARA